MLSLTTKQMEPAMRASVFSFFFKMWVYLGYIRGMVHLGGPIGQWELMSFFTNADMFFSGKLPKRNG